ncbi:MAG: helix-turn-helix domain-containing protein [Clostridia bacterium]
MRLRDLREDHDLTQANVAKYLHCAQNTYHQYETGKRQIPLTLLKKLATYYNTSIDYILELTDDIKTLNSKKSISNNNSKKVELKVK